MHSQSQMQLLCILTTGTKSLPVGADFAGTSSAGYAEKSPFLSLQVEWVLVKQLLKFGELKLVPTTAIYNNTVLVGKFGGGEAAHVVMRQGIDLAVSDSHSDFFIKNHACY